MPKPATAFEEFVDTFATAIELAAAGSIAKGRHLLQQALATAEKRDPEDRADQAAEHCRVALHCYLRRYAGEA